MSPVITNAHVITSTYLPPGVRGGNDGNGGDKGGGGKGGG